MSSQIQSTIQVLPEHNTLKSTIEQFLTINHKTTAISGGGEVPSSSLSSTTIREAEFFDFGIRYKIIATTNSTSITSASSTTITTKHNYLNSIIHTSLYVSIPEWERCKDDAIKRLTEIYKNSFHVVVATSDKNNNSDAKHQWKNKKKDIVSTEPTFDFYININDTLKNKFQNCIEECSTSLSQLRIQCIGSPIYYAMERIVVTESARQRRQQQQQLKEKEVTVNLIQSHPRCGECRCIGTNEKVLVIFTVRIDDEMERGLARVFLQQFAGAQKQIAQTPHCEFRRGNDTPNELLPSSRRCSEENNYDDDNAKYDSQQQQQQQQKLPLGYLAFTFFPMHLKTPQRLCKAVELMVNFLPYLDKHLKSTKSFMHSRMRAKKNDLLRELKEESTSSKMDKTTSSSTSAATTHGGSDAINNKKYGSSSSSFGRQQKQQKMKGIATTTTGWKKSPTTTTTGTTSQQHKYVSKPTTTSQQHKHFSRPHRFVPTM